MNILNAINEEIESFDFLNNNESNIEQENIDLLLNEDLQKQFICDSLLNKKDKIKIINVLDSSIGGDWENDNLEDINKLTIEYNLNIEYEYDINKKPIIFDLIFESNDININVGGWENPSDNITASDKDTWFNDVSWNDINVSLYSVEGDEIKFIAFEKAPANIQNLFIREFVETYISNHTAMIVKNKPNKSIITQYC